MSALMAWLQRTLPKPLLFGLYGALGALLGTVILGEALWAALQPPPPPPAPPPPLHRPRRRQCG